MRCRRGMQGWRQSIRDNGTFLVCWSFGSLRFCSLVTFDLTLSNNRSVHLHGSSITSAPSRDGNSSCDSWEMSVDLPYLKLTLNRCLEFREWEVASPPNAVLGSKALSECRIEQDSLKTEIVPLIFWLLVADQYSLPIIDFLSFSPVDIYCSILDLILLFSTSTWFILSL